MDILVDLDGTLVDPKPGIVGSIQFALRQLGAPVPPMDELGWAIGPPLRTTFPALLGRADQAEDAVALFTKVGASTVFENLEGFPEDWRTNPEGFVRYVREHHCPSFIEYGEYPYVTSDEIKKALRVKSALSEMLDQMQ